MVEICQGLRGKNAVLEESIEKYKEMFMKTKIEFQKLIAVSIPVNRSYYRSDSPCAASGRR